MSRRFGNNSQSDNYGKGVVVLDESEEAEANRAQEMAKRLRTAFNAPDFSPPVLPAAAMDVHRMSQARDVKLDQLLVALEKDPLLAARVLKVASSPVYGGQPLQSLHGAVTRLGLQNLSAIVWEVALNMKVFRSKIFEVPMDRVRRHSVAVAHCARSVAKLTSVPLEYAFLCGLLHDVGAAASLLVLGEGAQREQAIPHEVLDVVLGQVHASASQLIAKVWKLSPDLQIVLGSHHTVSVGGYPHPCASVIAIAEHFVRQLGSEFGLVTPAWDTTADEALLSAQRSLGFEGRAIDALRGELKQVLQNLEQTS